MKYNPFNFARPAEDEAGSWGRSNEAAEIDYYLNEASFGQLVNLAISGPHQIGKSSLMSYTRYKANEFGIMSLDISPWELRSCYRELDLGFVGDGLDDGEVPYQLSQQTLLLV